MEVKLLSMNGDERAIYAPVYLSPVPTRQKVGWAPKTVWTWLQREKFRLC